jgi:type I restriction enzyme, S subunit
MAGEWKEAKLGDVVELKRGYDLPQQNRIKGSVPLVSSSGVTDFHSEAAVKGPGVVTGRYGTLGQVFYIEEDFWPLNTTLYVKDFKGNDPRFISYFLRSLDFRAYSDKAAVPGLNRNHLHQAEVRIPLDVGEQRAIAHILGTLDDKIELNRRMNETLEAIARPIFKSWFVDFDPVRAKASGEPTESIYRRLGLVPDLLALFPDRLVESALGDIPAGWGAVQLGAVCRRVATGPFGSDIKTSNFVPQGVPVIRGGNLATGFVDDGFAFVTEEKADELRNANARPGDIVITHRGTLGQVGLIPPNASYPRYVVSQSQMVLTPDDEVATSRFLYEFLRTPQGQQALLANTSQVGVPAIARPTTSVKAIAVVVPPLNLQRTFGSVAGPLFERTRSSSAESRLLGVFRDILIPKLLAGEVRVPFEGAA